VIGCGKSGSEELSSNSKALSKALLSNAKALDRNIAGLICGCRREFACWAEEQSGIHRYTCVL
jgi:hypothetical protein